ncbi:MAG TPA: 30S ribosomal protein S6 [Patescibacteria group bacterium]|nr:30S ribosomal protein S6 [Patescibacteria group bacterium]
MTIFYAHDRLVVLNQQHGVSRCIKKHGPCLPPASIVASGDGEAKQHHNQYHMEQHQKVEQAEGGVFAFAPKEERIEHYEILVLLTQMESEQTAQSIIDSIKNHITDFGGMITHEENLGNRELAYTIAKARMGIFYTIEFDLPTSKLKEINEKLRIRKDITRFLIVKKHIKSTEELAEDERIRQKIEGRKKAKMLANLAVENAAQEKAAAKETAETKTPITPVSSRPAAVIEETPATPPQAKEQPAPTEEKAVKKPKTKKSLEELDKEIEKLLSDDIDL